MAQHSGYGALAAVCRVQITDRLLVEHRFDEAVETARRFLDAGEFSPSREGFILSNQVLALVQLAGYRRLSDAHDAARSRALPRLGSTS